MTRLGPILQKNEEKIFWIRWDLNPGPKKWVKPQMYQNGASDHAATES